MGEAEVFGVTRFLQKLLIHFTKLFECVPP